MCNDSLELQRSSSGGSTISGTSDSTSTTHPPNEFIESSNKLFSLMDTTSSSSSSSLQNYPIVESCNSLSTNTNTNTNGLTIYNLPKFLIYNILEYIHWDWFDEVTAARQREQDELNELDMDKLSSSRKLVNNSHLPSRMMIENLLRQMGVIVGNVETEEDQINNYNAVSEVMEYYLSQQGQNDGGGGDDDDDDYDEEEDDYDVGNDDEEQ
jgi:hypothetical protein